MEGHRFSPGIWNLSFSFCFSRKFVEGGVPSIFSGLKGLC